MKTSIILFLLLSFNSKAQTFPEPLDTMERMNKQRRFGQPEKDYFVLKRGQKHFYFVEVATGLVITDASSIDYTLDGLFVSAKYGVKKYRLKSEGKKHRLGYQNNFIQVSAFFNPKAFTISPYNMGLSFLTRYSNRIGTELNFTAGPSLMIDQYGLLIGLRMNPEFKYRYKHFSFGVDLGGMIFMGFSDSAGFWSFGSSITYMF